MTWCNGFNDVRATVESSLSPTTAAAGGRKAAASLAVLVKMCPSCGHRAHYEQVRTHSRSHTLVVVVCAEHGADLLLEINNGAC